MSSSRTLRFARRLLGTAAVLGSCLVVPALASARTWNGTFDHSQPTKLHFNYSGSKITKFTIPIVGCTSTTGYQTETIYVPSIAVHHGRFSVKYHPPKTYRTVHVKLSGKINASHASGTVNGTGLCDTGPQPFHANPGKFHKGKSSAPKKGSCTRQGCTVKNGVFIKVTGVDRAIKSVNDPSNIYDSTADPFLKHGGVGITVRGVDRKAHDPFTEPGISSLELRLGSGKLITGDPTLATVLGGNGKKFDCSDGYDQQQLTRGAKFGPISVCFDIPKASARHHLTLYYMPDGSDVLAKIPLG